MLPIEDKHMLMSGFRGLVAQPQEGLPTLLQNVSPEKIGVVLRALKALEEGSARAGRADLMAGIRLIRLALTVSKLPPLSLSALSSPNELTYRDLKLFQMQVNAAVFPLLILQETAQIIGRAQGPLIAVIKEGKACSKIMSSAVRPFKIDDLTRQLVKHLRADKKDYTSIALTVSILGAIFSKAFDLDTFALLLQIVVVMFGVIKIYSAVESPETDLASLKSLTRFCFDRQFSQFEARSEAIGGSIVGELEFQRNQFYDHLKDADQEIYIHQVLQSYAEVFLPSIATPEEIAEARVLLDKSVRLKERAERDIAEFKDRLQRCSDLLQERIEGGGEDIQSFPLAQFELRQQLQEIQELQSRLWLNEKAFPSQIDPIQRMPVSERLDAFAQIQRIEGRVHVHQ